MYGIELINHVVKSSESYNDECSATACT